MRIVSWNVFNRSRDIDRFERFVRETKADIFAFQELTPVHIARLEAAAGHTLHLAEDFAEEGEMTYLGLFTPHPARDHRVTPINPARDVSDSRVGRKNQWQECFESQSLDIEIAGETVRAFNLHLACAVSPRARAAQLSSATAALDGSRRAVICGDFNSFGKPWLSPLIGLPYGFALRDLVTDEIRLLDRFGARHGLERSPRRAVTFPKFRLHLDHIFTRGLAIRAVRVEADTHGSDHRPVIVDADG
jgi:endonuclease/exonuclease/phosphatase family metal-dependent hydrolase